VLRPHRERVAHGDHGGVAGGTVVAEHLLVGVRRLLAQARRRRREARLPTSTCRRREGVRAPGAWNGASHAVGHVPVDRLMTHTSSSQVLATGADSTVSCAAFNRQSPYGHASTRPGSGGRDGHNLPVYTGVSRRLGTANSRTKPISASPRCSADGSALSTARNFVCAPAQPHLKQRTEGLDQRESPQKPKTPFARSALNSQPEYAPAPSGDTFSSSRHPCVRLDFAAAQPLARHPKPP